MTTGTPHPSLRGVVLRYEGFAARAVEPVTIRELAGVTPTELRASTANSVQDGTALPA
jgi:hypothetical protein